MREKRLPRRGASCASALLAPLLLLEAVELVVVPTVADDVVAVVAAAWVEGAPEYEALRFSEEDGLELLLKRASILDINLSVGSSEIR